jgi:methylenetetrahydrofolate reductase (NADPH)
LPETNVAALEVVPGEPGEARSALDATLRAGRFAVTAEVTPPRGADPGVAIRKAEALRDWVDGINFTDNPSALVRMSSWGASVALMRAGIDPICQFTCRDRNRIALQSDLLGASAAGIPNVLLLTGDYIGFGDHPDAKEVFDLDSIQLVWMAARMRDEGKLQSGGDIRTRPNWFIGAVENPFAPPTRFRATRLGKKVAAGAQFIQTQFVFDLAQFETFMTEVVDLGLAEHCSIIAGLGPVRSQRMLTHMRQELPGVVIPDSVAKRLESATDIEEEAVSLCAETIAAVRAIPGVAGVHVMAYGFEQAIPDILSRAGIAPRATEVAHGGGQQ